MTKIRAAFYARVSGEQQAAAHTIESQIDEEHLACWLIGACSCSGVEPFRRAATSLTISNNSCQLVGLRRALTSCIHC